MISRHTLFVVGLTLAMAGAGVATAQETAAPPGDSSGSTVDHSKLEALQKEFMSGPEVTEACLSCHTEAASQVKASIHWSWDYEHPETGVGIITSCFTYAYYFIPLNKLHKLHQ